MPEPLLMETVGADIGDTGAAAGGVALLRALASLRSPSWAGQAGRSSSLVYGGADHGAIAACLVVPGARERRLPDRG